MKAQRSAQLIILGALCMNLSTPSSVAESQPQQEKPCSRPEYRQFDFWLGSWTVSENGKVAGTNHIESILGGCGVHESWRGAGGNEGNSLNYYDAPRQVWHQTWIDQSGNALVLEGRFEHGAMRLQGQRPGKSAGQVDQHRITWTPLAGGNVRQLWEVSSDGGKTWAQAFDGLYTPAK
ncbi:MAG TPA: hypothetical protein VKB41_14065 [Steroidobacteraceae bacterium]|nr:hypothetical protein [Steroidobacteraceae bacterium]